MGSHIVALARLRMVEQDCVGPSFVSGPILSRGRLRTGSSLRRDVFPRRVRSEGDLAIRAERRKRVGEVSGSCHRGFGQAWRYAVDVRHHTALWRGRGDAPRGDFDNAMQREFIKADELVGRLDGHLRWRAIQVQITQSKSSRWHLEP